jgi:hypothetical protein
MFCHVNRIHNNVPNIVFRIKFFTFLEQHVDVLQTHFAFSHSFGRFSVLRHRPCSSCYFNKNVAIEENNSLNRFATANVL